MCVLCNVNSVKTACASECSFFPTAVLKSLLLFYFASLSDHNQTLAQKGRLQFVWHMAKIVTTCSRQLQKNHNLSHPQTYICDHKL